MPRFPKNSCALSEFRMSRIAIQCPIDLYAPLPPLEPPLYASESSVLDLRTAAAVEESRFPMLMWECDFLDPDPDPDVDVDVVFVTGY